MLTAAPILLDGTTLAREARERNAGAREAIATLLERGGALYGATTGVGALRDRVIGDSDRERFQWSLFRSRAVSGRPSAERRVCSGGHGHPRWSGSDFLERVKVSD